MQMDRLVAAGKLITVAFAFALAGCSTVKFKSDETAPFTLQSAHVVWNDSAIQMKIQWKSKNPRSDISEQQKKDALSAIAGLTRQFKAQAPAKLAERLKERNVIAGSQVTITLAPVEAYVFLGVSPEPNLDLKATVHDMKTDKYWGVTIFTGLSVSEDAVDLYIERLMTEMEKAGLIVGKYH